jgi:LmbE family N-acetylglucosaminyl deacetylase
MLSNYIKWRAAPVEERTLKRSAVVFSPHPDDETLSCGGTLAKKKLAGADVKVYFMTDGGRSHPDLISEAEMAQIRAAEAVAACRVLGFSRGDVFFLGFRDGALSASLDSAAQKVLEVFRLHEPEEVFVPYRKEPKMWSLDHLCTNQAVWRALQVYGKAPAVYEYPTWLWYNQPWTNKESIAARQLAFAFKQRFTSKYNLLHDFRCSVDIHAVLATKRAALNQYKSQITQLVPNAAWHTLGDLSRGKFLECFFQDYEFFSLKKPLATQSSSEKTAPLALFVNPVRSYQV